MRVARTCCLPGGVSRFGGRWFDAALGGEPVGEGLLLRLGQGDDQLGAILMKSFFVSLQELQPAPRAILLLNGGVHLAVEGSPVLAGLQELSRRGVNVLVCGTCLDFFQLKDKLAVGSVTNMYSILTELTGASRAITL